MDIRLDAFEKLVTEGYEKLPQWVRDKIKNVALLVEEEPSYEDRLSAGLVYNETLLGLYKGIPLAVRGESYGVGMTLPDTVTLYMLPILEVAEEEHKSVQEVIAETIWHEFAHHFGMDESHVCERERERAEILGTDIGIMVSGTFLTNGGTNGGQAHLIRERCCIN